MNENFTIIGRAFALLAVSLFAVAPARAQTTLSAGDLVFTAFNIATNTTPSTDAYYFVLLKNVSSGTIINFTDIGHEGNGVFTAYASSDSKVTFTTSGAFTAGTEIKIEDLTATVVSTGASAGTVTAVSPATGGLNLSIVDQVIAYQGTLGSSPTMIAGLHWNNCSQSGTIQTTDAAWDPPIGASNACSYTSGGVTLSTMPPGLSSSTGAMWTEPALNTFHRAGKFGCTGTPFANTMANINTLRTNILNKANWTFYTSSTGITVPGGCTYIGVAAPVVSTNPASQTVCAGSTAAFSATATGGGTLTYQWQVSTTGTGGTYTNVSGSNYAGATTTTLTVNNTPASFNGYAYRLSVTNSGGTTASAGALLTVEAGVPAIGAQPSDAVACVGGTTIIAASAAGGTIAYRWQVSSGGGFSNLTDGSIYSGTGTSSLTISNAPLSLNGNQYRLTATNTCGTANSNAATLIFRNTWNGSTSSNWNTASNWSCNSVPNVNSDVVIPNVATAPVVSTTNAVARNITINSGASLTVATNSTLEIAGAITNAGAFTTTASGARINFNSSSAQTIPAGTYANITVAGGGSKSLGGNATITENITFTSGKIILGSNTLIMASTAGSPVASSSNYVVVNGSGGFKRMNVGSSPVTFPVGSATNYTPFSLSNSGTTDNFTGRVIDNVYVDYTGETPVGAAVSTRSVAKTWFVTEDVAGGSNATLTVQWNATDELPFFVRSACFLAHYINGGWPGGPVMAASGSNPYTTSRSGITSFSPFGVGSAGSPLPANLLAFEGRLKESAVELLWEVTPEQNLKGYTIERSYDGNRFESLAFVNAQGKSSYTYTDANAAGKTEFYYRLKVEYISGAFSYSKVVAIAPAVETVTSWAVGPNPIIGDEIFLLPGNEDAAITQILITDLNGRIVQKQEVNITRSTALSLRGLPAGSYVLVLKVAGNLKSFKLERR